MKERSDRMKKKKRMYNIAIAILFVAGGGMLLYPAVSNLWNQFQQSRVIVGYQKGVDGYSKEELDAMRQEARLYNENLLKDEIIIDPFTQVKDRKADVQYYETLNPMKNGVMGGVRIPKIDVDLPIYHGTSEDVLQKAIGHMEQTSLPIGGAGTHAVISGHRGLPSAELFTDLNLLEKGDLFYLDVLGETLAYEVDQIKTVEPTDLEALAIISGEDHVTLVTCTPYAINTHRLLVRGTRVPYVEENDPMKNPQNENRKRIVWIAAATLAVVLLIAGMILAKRKKKKRKKKRRRGVAR